MAKMNRKIDKIRYFQGYDRMIAIHEQYQVIWLLALLIFVKILWGAEKLMCLSSNNQTTSKLIFNAPFQSMIWRIIIQSEKPAYSDIEQRTILIVFMIGNLAAEQRP